MILPERYALVIGGAGFIGTNLSHALAEEGRSVLVFDNLSRTGVQANLDWLLRKHPRELVFMHGDVRDPDAVREAVSKATVVFHLAAQVAVTCSVEDPVTDFEINSRGTLNVLEAIRRAPTRIPIIFTSTNKVLGTLEHIRLTEYETRYEPTDAKIRLNGVGDEDGIAFCSPYGCSKGAADQYVLDYARTFGLQTLVFRMSCIYGPHQCGNEDQGWVAHFVKRAIAGEPITFYGNGKQVRDALFVGDLITAFMLGWKKINELSGRVFNIGGGPSHTISLIELVSLLSNLQQRSVSIRYDDWRPSDQRYYVSDTSKYTAATGWRPLVDVPAGVEQLFHWLKGPRTGSKEALKQLTA
ncbi:MAG: CDP-paratose 2-epimerase [Bdellovibrionales bacterium RIFOXYC1_FULL_54_43]|nr:MAG: CDP-paratose 2-epimerase [Bdellovibrionales bacterium RIFOXYC1_FULL_54_43]OFZ80632.1 MAG: CDP-paratose 2-epimerase [Bdellovibrionales bacterium RIFOXYD1_FULL_55_31]